jgi:hypothetical protein
MRNRTAQCRICRVWNSSPCKKKRRTGTFLEKMMLVLTWCPAFASQGQKCPRRTTRGRKHRSWTRNQSPTNTTTAAHNRTAKRKIQINAFPQHSRIALASHSKHSQNPRSSASLTTRHPPRSTHIPSRATSTRYTVHVLALWAYMTSAMRLRAICGAVQLGKRFCG